MYSFHFIVWMHIFRHALKYDVTMFRCCLKWMFRFRFSQKRMGSGRGMPNALVKLFFRKIKFFLKQYLVSKIFKFLTSLQGIKCHNKMTEHFYSQKYNKNIGWCHLWYGQSWNFKNYIKWFYDVSFYLFLFLVVANYFLNFKGRSISY